MEYEAEKPKTKECKLQTCKNLFNPIYPNQKYCSPECSSIARKDSKRKHSNTYYHKWKNHPWKKDSRKDLGTGSLGSKPHPCFESEQELVFKEKKRLKLLGIPLPFSLLFRLFRITDNNGILTDDIAILLLLFFITFLLLLPKITDYYSRLF